MPDYNIIVKNMLGSGSGAKRRLSAKKSSKQNKSTMNIAKNIKKASKGDGGAQSAIGLVHNSISIRKIAGSVKTPALIATMITVANKGANFGIHLKEAETGNRLRAQNTKNSLDIVTSLGMSLLKGGVENELFTKKVISRQNFGLDYGREIYNLNIEGSKYKRI